MRILLYLYPALLAQGPAFNGGWSLLLLNVMRGLVAAGRECHMITASRFKDSLGPDLEGLSISYINDLKLHQDVIELDARASIPSELLRIARTTQDAQSSVVNLLIKQITATSGGFTPDIVITFAVQADYIKSIWPNAHVFYVEAGAFSRSPYPFTLFFDHQGMYHNSVVAQLCADEMDVDAGVLALAQDIRTHAAQMLIETDPFAEFNFRERFDRLVLLPLQVSNYFSFDDQAPYRTQFEFLLEVMASSPKDVGIIVTEYIQWGEVLRFEGPGQNLDWLSKNFPNAIFHEDFRKLTSPSQYLATRVDGLITICSNLGYQALLLEKRLGCGYDSFLKNVAHDMSIQQFFTNLQQGTETTDRLKFIAWYIERYAVPESLYNDGHWFSDYLERRVKAIEVATKPEDGFVPIATPDVLRKHWIKPVTKEMVAKRGMGALGASDSRTHFSTIEKMPIPLVPLRVGESRAIDLSQMASYFCFSEGFNLPEQWGAWSNGKNAKLLLPIDLADTAEVEITITMIMKAFEGIIERAPVVQIAMNNSVVGYVLFRPSSKNQQEISFTRRIRTSPCQIDFSMSHSGAPQLLNLSYDGRELGFGLCGLSITVSSIKDTETNASDAKHAPEFFGVSELNIGGDRAKTAVLSNAR